MRIYSSEPLYSLTRKIRRPLDIDDIRDENVYEDTWLPFGDDKETDVLRLIQQNRISKQ